jgi:GAF domain-containing protein
LCHPTATCGSWPPPARPCAYWSCSSCKPSKARASTATAPANPVLNQDLTALNNRWPRFAAEALAAGFHSVHALPLRLRGTVIGALNLFQLEPGELRRADVDAAQALADVATIAILSHRATAEAQAVNEQLNHALNSRVVIEQAKGMIAERAGLDMEQAFSALRAHARNQNLRLVDVCRDVIGGFLAATALDRRPPATPS